MEKKEKKNRRIEKKTDKSIEKNWRKQAVIKATGTAPQMPLTPTLFGRMAHVWIFSKLELLNF